MDIQIYLVLSVEGDLSFEAELPVEASVYYKKDKGFRNFKHEISPGKLTIETNCDASVMLGLEPTLCVLGCINIMDAEAEIGVTASANDIQRPDLQTCTDISISFPVITLSVCGDDDADTMIGNIGLSAEWEVISSDDAPIRFGLHYECFPDKIARFVKECTYKENDEEGISDAEETIQMSNIYYTRYKEITGIERPVFCFDYPSGWTITREEVVEDSDEDIYMNYYGEIVELTNDRGVYITYTQYKIDPGMAANGSVFQYTVEYEVEKVENSGLKLAYGLNSEELMVARIKETGGVDPQGNHYDSDMVSYAVLIRDEEGLQITDLPGYDDMCSFYYPEPDSFQIETMDGSTYTINPYTVIATSPDGQFTEKEEREVIAILSSFREAP